MEQSFRFSSASTIATEDGNSIGKSVADVLFFEKKIKNSSFIRSFFWFIWNKRFYKTEFGMFLPLFFRVACIRNDDHRVSKMV